MTSRAGFSFFANELKIIAVGKMTEPLMNAELTPPNFPRTLRAPMTSQERGFQEFAEFAAKLKGDEKSEVQAFL
jgi:hypothetical protein